MKAYHLLSSLTAAEKKSFDIVIKNKGRNSLSQLYMILKKSKENKFEKENLFNSTFKQLYSKEKDYLLRNELRLLANALKQFITEKEWEKATSENLHVANYWYLKALLSRKLVDVYDGEYPDIYKAAKENLQLQLLPDLALDHFSRLRLDLTKHLDFDGMLKEADNFHQHLRELAAY